MWQHKVPNGTILLLGRQGPLLKGIARAQKQCRDLGGKKIAIIIPPRGKKGSWHKIVTFKAKVHHAEACLMKSVGECVVFTSRDCHTLTISYENKLGAAHVGRESMTPRCSRSVIHNLMQALGVTDGKKVRAFVSGGICGKHFRQEESSDHVEPLVKMYGREVLADETTSALDMFRVIKACLNLFGVADDQISHDGLCTYEHEGLGSKRAERPGSNWTFVLKTE